MKITEKFLNIYFFIMIILVNFKESKLIKFISLLISKTGLIFCGFFQKEQFWLLTWCTLLGCLHFSIFTKLFLLLKIKGELNLCKLKKLLFLDNGNGDDIYQLFTKFIKKIYFYQDLCRKVEPEFSFLIGIPLKIPSMIIGFS